MTDLSGQAMVVRGLRKVFKGQDGNPDKVAVNNLMLAIGKSECFGLLGPNGAGKVSLLFDSIQTTSEVVLRACCLACHASLGLRGSN